MVFEDDADVNLGDEVTKNWDQADSLIEQADLWAAKKKKIDAIGKNHDDYAKRCALELK